MLTNKSDVYIFGVVLPEIISGRQLGNAKLGAEERNLVRWVRNLTFSPSIADFGDLIAFHSKPVIFYILIGGYRAIKHITGKVEVCQTL